MNYTLLVAFDRGAKAAGILILVMLAADLISLLLMPVFYNVQNQRLKQVGGKIYGFLGIATTITGFVLIPAVLLVVVTAAVARFRGTGIYVSRSTFVLGFVMWLSAPLILFLLGRFQMGLSRRLDPSLWDKKARTARRRQQIALRRQRSDR